MSLFRNDAMLVLIGGWIAILHQIGRNARLSGANLGDDAVELRCCGAHLVKRSYSLSKLP
jgi:hypothetical protein